MKGAGVRAAKSLFFLGGNSFPRTFLVCRVLTRSPVGPCLISLIRHQNSSTVSDFSILSKLGRLRGIPADHFAPFLGV